MYNINGKPYMPPKTDYGGETLIFATINGGGSGISWEEPCTFREAVALCTGSKAYRIYLGAGAHDTDNGSSGTTISAANVTIVGMGLESGVGQMSTLVNKNASATHILRATADRFAIEKVTFNNGYETATDNIIQLDIRGNEAAVHGCIFTQVAGDTGITGMVLTNSTVGHTATYNKFIGVAVGIECGSISYFTLEDNSFLSCTTGLYASNANANIGICTDNKYLGCTTAMNITAAQNNTWYCTDTKYFNNTANVTAFSDYAGTVFIQGSMTADGREFIYPPAETPGTGGTGIACSTGNGTWVWTAAATTIIPADKITTPFVITSINLQTWNAEQTYRIELFYGHNAANISLGIHEITVGVSDVKTMVNTKAQMSAHIPANAMIGAKVCSNTAGVDSVTITLSYQKL